MISVGIDVSKEKCMVCILRPYGEVISSPHEITYTDQSVAGFINGILALEAETKVVMEATGTYHLPLLVSLKQAGIFVSVINPLVMKKYASTALRKGKTDKLDSVRIANYGLDNWFHLVDFTQSGNAYEELKILGRQYSHYISIKIQSTLALASILDRTMPGIKKLLASSDPTRPDRNKLSDFVEEFWHYDNITKKTESRFVSDYCRWAKKKGYRANVTKANGIYAVARAGIPTLSSSSASTKMLVLEAVRVLHEVNKTLQLILAQMQEIASSMPEYETVRAMPGVGAVLAPRLIAEIGDVRRFHSGSALIAYAGIDSPPFESGAFVGVKRHISKRGSSLLRKTGYEVMKCLKTVKPAEDATVYQLGCSSKRLVFY